MSDWSDTPPTALGWYWLKNRVTDDETASKNLQGSHWMLRGGIVHSSHVAQAYQFGSRIPSREELLAMRQQIADLTAQRDAAEAELEAATQPEHCLCGVDIEAMCKKCGAKFKRDEIGDYEIELREEA